MPVVLVLAPLVQYENLAISFLAAIFLITQGKRWLGIATIVCIGLLVGGFSLFLMSLGLAPLPASVIVKSKVELDQSGIFNTGLNIMINLYTKPGITLTFLLLIIITGVFINYRYVQETIGFDNHACRSSTHDVWQIWMVQ